MTKLDEMNSWLLALRPFGLTKNDEIKSKLEAQNIEVFDFTLGDPKEPTPDFIKKALIENIDSVSQYPQNIGCLQLRQTCAKWVKNRLSIDINAQNQIISSNGSKEAIFHIPHVILNSSSIRRMIISPEPGYPVYKAGTVLAGGIPYVNPLKTEKNYIFDPSEVPQELTNQIAAIWLCYPHNPTGAVIKKNQMEKIYKWACEHNIIILSDECYIDMYYEGNDSPNSFLEISSKENFKNVICFFSLSKRSGMTGYRSGFIAGDSELLTLYAKYRLNVGLGTPDFIQKAAISAWSDTNHVRERNKIFAKKRELVDAFFKTNNISVLPSCATFYVWGNVPNSYQSDFEFVNKILETTGIMLTPGSVFGESCNRNFRMALVPTVDKISECLKIWQAKINSGEIKL
ncbi:aminotransferase class I/II-fold pyridoxal phosphate-dependent enzyme [Pigmentibacter ruber]|uniref:aminotransferase class I/II-fold pyridoxal phosphate-dependent enzyme n=1 Tax=Pigmentibacter ruber TaxID=2683196 RepID=UPI00131D5CB4|nr:aminotransferase class I/II-fold pyridoxal phosphate-dependent enzyme [Pigmentibacter ruber]